MKNDTDTAVLGWLSVNGILQVITKLFHGALSHLSEILVVSQIAVAVATVILLFWKIRAARRSAKDKD
jgi:hypothetical protein